MEKTYELYNGVTSYVHYLSHLLGDNIADPKKITDKDNIALSKLALIQNFFLLSKKEVLNRKGNLYYTSKVIDEYLEELVDVILPKTKKGYLVGGEVLNKSQAITIIRNKIAYGEYYFDLESNTISLKTIPTETIIPLQRLDAVITGVSNALVKHNNTDTTSKIIVQNENNSFKAIRSEEELRCELESTIMRKYSLKSTKNKRIEESDLNEFSKLISVINDYLKNGISFNDILDSYKKTVSKKGLEFAEEKTKFSTTEINLIIDIISRDKSFYSRDYLTQKKKINELMIALKCPEYNSEGLMIGTAKNLLILDGKDNSGRINGDVFLSALVSEFLTLYKPLLSCKYKEFDFSKLDLDRIKPSKYTTYSKMLKAKREDYAHYRKGLNESLEELKQYHEDYYKVRTEEDRNYLLMKIELKEIEIDELKKILDSIDAKLKKICDTNPKNIDNRSIINSIIKTITYGTVVIRKNLNTNNKTIRDYVIVFKHKDFELNITVEDFLGLFREHNLSAISKHFGKVEKMKKKVRK